MNLDEIPKPIRYELSETGYRITYLAEVVQDTQNKKIIESGFTRKTKISAQLAANRMIRMMRLSALAAELGGEKEFIEGEDNFYIFQDKHKWVIGLTLGLFHPEKVYMNAKCAREICRMLNAGEFKL